MTTDFGPSRRHPADRPGAVAASPRSRELGPLLAAFITLGPGAVIAQARFADFERLPGVVSGGASSWIVHPVDVNEDGHAEIVGGFGEVRYWFNNRRGRFLGPVTPPNQPTFGASYQLGIGDVNGDGHVDIFVPRVFLQLKIPPDSLFLGDGRGGFVDVAATHLPAKLQFALCATFGDVDGDGDLDAVIGCISVFPGQAEAQNVVYLNDGTGHFREDPNLASFPPDYDNTWALRLADLDGDGLVDLVCGNDASLGGDSKIYLNSGTGHFTLKRVVPMVIASKIEVGDIDGDGDLDIGLFGSSNGFSPPILLENDGRANFTDISHRLPSQTWEFQGAAFGDVDDDGDLDIVIPRWPEPVGPNLYLAAYEWINDGTGHFTDVTAATMPRFEGNSWGGYRISRLELADMDADGDLDIITDRVQTFAPPDSNRIYWNLTRQIYAPAAARPGKGYDLELYSRAGHIAVPAVAIRPAQLPLGSLGIFGLDPATVVSGQGLVMPTSGKSVLSFTVPNNPALVGKRIFWQAIDIDPGNPAAARLTNVFEETFVQ